MLTVKVHSPGQAEIQQFYEPAGGHHDIPGFQISMDLSAGVYPGQSAGNLHRVVQQLPDGNPFDRDHIPQGFSLDEFHGDEIHAAFGADLVHRHDVWMV